MLTLTQSKSGAHRRVSPAPPDGRRASPRSADGGPGLGPARIDVDPENRRRPPKIDVDPPKIDVDPPIIDVDPPIIDHRRLAPAKNPVHFGVDPSNLLKPPHTTEISLGPAHRLSPRTHRRKNYFNAAGSCRPFPNRYEPYDYASPEISGGGLAFGKEDESPELGSSLNRSQRGNCSTEYNTPLRHLSRLRTIPSPDIELPVMGHPMMYRPSQTPRLAVSSDRITLGSVLPVGGGPRKRPPSTGRGSRRATPRTPNDKRKRGSAAGNPIRLAREYRRAVGEYPTTDALRLTEFRVYIAYHPPPVSEAPQTSPYKHGRGT
ncbi:hypothetical protein AAG570_004833 [Ranatra chinensis]|uniref:Uncharacterized protein n=1 Tax=Ranatra chinensis TaxID=642074 RepID=A0ABD0YBF2_9HEMI